MNAANGKTFEQALTQAYCLQPGQVLPNALWKTLARLNDTETTFCTRPDGGVSHLEIWQSSRLILYWDTDRQHLDLTGAQIAGLTFALLHQDYLKVVSAHRSLPFSRQTAYFRLTRPALAAANGSLPEGFQFRDVDICSSQYMQEAEQIAQLLAKCYEDIHPTAETVLSWTRSSAFTPEGWVWLWDQKLDCPAGLGIADLDSSISEGSLEWIQLLPAYRGRGLGQALVNELTARLSRSADFISVSGQVDHPSQPERLYRRCGFTGQDVWWVLED